jgi:hypothetical protein
MKKNKPIAIIILIVLCFAIFFSGCAEQSNEQIGQDTPANTPLTTETIDDSYIAPFTYTCNWDWTFFTTKTIDYSTAPVGYTYAVCTVYLQNNATDIVSTNPWNWALVVDGVAYDHDSVTYSESIAHNTVDVGYGGEFETRFVFQVQDDTQNGILVYTGYNGPTMNRIDHYKSSDEIAAEKAQKLQTTSESFLDSLIADGHDISGFKIGTTEIYNEEQCATIFVTDNISEVKYIFELGLEAYQQFASTDVYVVRVDGRDYWTPVDDIRKYKAQNLKYESAIYVYFPTGQKVTLENLPHRID